jgi:hypothetical protein
MGEAPERSQLRQMDTKTTRACAEAEPVAGQIIRSVEERTRPDYAQIREARNLR